MRERVRATGSDGSGREQSVLERASVLESVQATRVARERGTKPTNGSTVVEAGEILHAFHTCLLHRSHVESMCKAERAVWTSSGG